MILGPLSVARDPVEVPAQRGGQLLAFLFGLPQPLGGVEAALDALGQVDLLLRVEQRDLADLLEVGPDRVGRRGELGVSPSLLERLGLLVVPLEVVGVGLGIRLRRFDERGWLLDGDLFQLNQAEVLFEVDVLEFDLLAALRVAGLAGSLLGGRGGSGLAVGRGGLLRRRLLGRGLLRWLRWGGAVLGRRGALDGRGKGGVITGARFALDHGELGGPGSAALGRLGGAVAGGGRGSLLRRVVGGIGRRGVRPVNPGRGGARGGGGGPRRDGGARPWGGVGLRGRGRRTVDNGRSTIAVEVGLRLLPDHALLCHVQPSVANLRLGAASRRELLLTPLLCGD